MENKDLKTGMQIEMSDGRRRLVLIGCDVEERTTVQVNAAPDGNGFNRLYDHFSLHRWDEDLKAKSTVVNDVVKVYGSYGQLLWERKEPVAITIDGVDYSESTLRSLIRKATTL